MDFAYRSKTGYGKVPESIDEASDMAALLNEKRKTKAKVKSTGEYSDKTIGELEKMRDNLMKKEKRTKAESTKVREINYAIRAKRHWKGGAK